jgi:hypothetical protein
MMPACDEPWSPEHAAITAAMPMLSARGIRSYHRGTRARTVPGAKKDGK